MENYSEKPIATPEALAEVNRLQELIEAESDKNKEDKLFQSREKIISSYCWGDIPFKDDGKIGLKDILGRVVVPAQFDNVLDCDSSVIDAVSSVCRVEINGKIGLVRKDGSGTMVIPAEYDEAYDIMYFNGYGVMKDGKWSILNRNGEEIVPFIIDEILEPYGSCLFFKSEGKIGCIDPKCELPYVPAEYESYELASIDEPYKFVRDGKEGYVTGDGKFISEDELDDYNGYIIGEWFD